MSLDPGPLVQCGRGRVVSRGQECAPGRVETGWHNLQRHGTWSPDCGKDTCDPVTCHVTRSQPAYRVGRSGTGARPLRRLEDIMGEDIRGGSVVESTVAELMDPREDGEDPREVGEEIRGEDPDEDAEDPMEL